MRTSSTNGRRPTSASSSPREGRENKRAHVPQFSNQGLIKFWEHNEFSHVLRDPAIQLQLTQAVIAERGMDPAKFDHQHPVLGHLIRNPDYLMSVLKSQVAHPRNFAHYHHHLLPFLFGYERLLQQELDKQKSTPVPPLFTPCDSSPAPTPETITKDPVTHPDQTNPNAVPEPSGIVLAGIALAVVGTGLLVRRRMACHPGGGPASSRA